MFGSANILLGYNNNHLTNRNSSDRIYKLISYKSTYTILMSDFKAKKKKNYLVVNQVNKIEKQILNF